MGDGGGAVARRRRTMDHPLASCSMIDDLPQRKRWRLMGMGERWADNEERGRYVLIKDAERLTRHKNIGDELLIVY